MRRLAPCLAPLLFVLLLAAACASSAGAPEAPPPSATVAEAATAVESLAGQSGAIALTGAMDRLAAAVAEARAVIEEMKQAR